MDRETADAILTEASSVISDERMAIVRGIIDGEFSSADLEDTVRDLLNANMSSGEQSKIAEVLWKIMYADDDLVEEPDKKSSSSFVSDSVYDAQGCPVIEYISDRTDFRMDIDDFSKSLDYLISACPFTALDKEIYNYIRKMLISKAFNYCYGVGSSRYAGYFNERSKVRQLIRSIRPDLHYGNKKD